MTKAFALTVCCKSHRKQKQKSWHKERPNACTEETASLANHQITSDCGGQHRPISGTNLNAVWSWKKNCTSLEFCVKAAVPRDRHDTGKLYLITKLSCVYFTISAITSLM